MSEPRKNLPKHITDPVVLDRVVALLKGGKP